LWHKQEYSFRKIAVSYYSFRFPLT
jgi:hypothetical protein